MLREIFNGWEVGRKSREEKSLVLGYFKLTFAMSWLGALVCIMIVLMPSSKFDLSDFVFGMLAFIFVGIALCYFGCRVLSLLVDIHHHQIYPTLSFEELQKVQAFKGLAQVERLAGHIPICEDEIYGQGNPRGSSN